MRVCAALYHPDLISDELYRAALGRVDYTTREKINRFYRREDACRTLIGALLLRLELKDQGLLTESMKISKTPEGKPYLENQPSDAQIAFNITHDNALISMVFAPGVNNPPAFSVGIDVMKPQIPARDTVDSFIEVFEEQLTALEKSQITSETPAQERIERFFWMWTAKEAYTKALGLGLGFDFSRVEFDAVNRQVRVNGVVPTGWAFTLFVVRDGEDRYQGVVAEYVGGEATVVVDETKRENPSWLTVWDAQSVCQRAVTELPEDNGE